MASVLTVLSEGVGESFDVSSSKSTPSSAANQSNINIGDRLRVIRSSHGISKQELSARLGIDSEVLNLYEAGERRVSANLLLRIAKLLDVRPRYFFQNWAKTAS
jgi:ribosome-binding protein aMBF1 (putative translation factor)